MKHILLLHNTLKKGGGAERMRYTLLKNLNRKDYKVKVCCLGVKGALGQMIEKFGYEVDEMRLDHRPSNLLTTYRLVKYLRRHKIDTLHTCLFDSNFHGRIAAFICGIPHVITEEHSEHYLYNKKRHYFFILSDFLLSKITDRIICCSESVKRDIMRREKLPGRKLRAVNNALDPSMYKIGESRDIIREKFNIKEEEKVFIATGSFARKKRHVYLLSVLKAVKDSGYSFKCFFAGRGPEKENIKAKIKELGLEENIIFLDVVDNIQDYLNASDIFLLPSSKEGLSLALMEAMYLGLPCIATEIDANKVLIENYRNGILVPLNDEDKFKKALIFCLENPQEAEAMGNNARVTIESRFLVKDYVKRFCAVWDQLNNS